MANLKTNLTITSDGAISDNTDTTTQKQVANGCENCDCGKNPVDHKLEYINHLEQELCKDIEKQCDTCPHKPENGGKPITLKKVEERRPGGAAKKPPKKPPNLEVIEALVS